MHKKTTIFLTTLSILSMICVGFATWNVTITPANQTINGNVIVDDVVNVSDVGIFYRSSQGFEYYTVSDASGNQQVHFSSTSLLSEVSITKATFENLSFDDTQKYYLWYECFYIYSKTNTIDLMTDTSFITAPTELIVKDKSLENSFFRVPVITEKKDYSSTEYIFSIAADIPLKSSYENCINQLVEFNTNSSSPYIQFILSFTNPTDLLNTYFEDFQTIQMNYSFTVKEKTN